MKYLDKKFIVGENNFDLSKEERERLDIEWRQQCDDYNKEYQATKHRFPKILREIHDNGCFHDAFINSIRYERILKNKRKTIFNIILDIDWQDRKGLLIHSDVKNFVSNIELTNYIPFGDYLYGEFLIDEKGLCIHNFLLYFDSEINITCKKINFQWITEKRKSNV